TAAARPAARRRADRGRPADAHHQHRVAPARHGHGPVGRTVPDGHHRDDHRAHVRGVGGTRCGRRHQGGRRQHGRRRPCLYRDGPGLARVPGIRVPGAVARRAGGGAPARPLHRLPALGAQALQGAGPPLTMFLLSTRKRLRQAGVLGINERSADYIMRLNPRRYYPRVDDKVLTKKLALEAGMPVPELYGVIESQGQVRHFLRVVEGREAFVVKPAHGSGGEGIIVIVGRSKRKSDAFRLANGLLITASEIEHHISNVVGGQYSLGGKPDSAIIEYCVRFDPMFSEVSYQGVPDVRIIVYRGYPVMSMVRLPTRNSDGKANLHQGAVGAGIDISTGQTLTGVLGNEVVDEHPDTGAPIAGLYIPHWDYILQS